MEMLIHYAVHLKVIYCLWKIVYSKKFFRKKDDTHTHIMQYDSAIKKEWDLAIFNNMDGYRGYYANERYHRKRYTIWFNLHMKSKNQMNK